MERESMHFCKLNDITIIYVSMKGNKAAQTWSLMCH